MICMVNTPEYNTTVVVHEDIQGEVVGKLRDERTQSKVIIVVKNA